ncbi:MAG: hypothetical protein R2824_07655 [Saprospiraceae bacterium]|nr:hypothetical protein [Lewinella sp.]
MKKLYLLFFSIFLLSVSCKKEESATPMKDPTIIQDQEEVEKTMVGSWAGVLNGGGNTENIEVIINKMAPGEKVAEGKYFDPTFSCGFDWTYELFSNGKVVFREKTHAPNMCYDELAVIAHLEDNDLDILHISIRGPNGGLGLGKLDRK